MDAYDPMSKSYSYTSVDSPDINYDVSYQQNSEFFDKFFTYDEWMNEDQQSIVPEYQDHTQVYASPAIDDGSRSIGSSSNSGHLQGESSGKLIFTFFHVCNMSISPHPNKILTILT